MVNISDEIVEESSHACRTINSPKSRDKRVNPFLCNNKSFEYMRGITKLDTHGLVNVFNQKVEESTLFLTTLNLL